MAHKLILFVFATLAVSVANSAIIEHKNFTSLQEALHDAEQYIVKFNETYNFPSLVFGISVKGKTVFEKAWGFSDLESSLPAKITTKYRIASISKTFTAAIIAGLVEKGLIHSFDDPIGKYLSESTIPTKKWQGHSVNITIRHLLSHAGGLHVNDDMKDFEKLEPVQNVTQMLYHFKDEALQFAPGSRFNYSNYGFQLLGGIIETLTKKTFQDVMTDFLREHGLSHSHVANMSQVIHGISRFYQRSPYSIKANIPAVTIDTALMVNGYWPAGGVISTVDDLIKYGHLMIDSYKGKKNAILSSKTVKQMWTAHSPRNSTEMNMVASYYQIASDYGLGWIVANDNPKLKHQKIVWHAGGMPGVATMLVLYPDEEMVGVAMSNKGAGHVLAPMVTYTADNIYNLIK